MYKKVKVAMVATPENSFNTKVPIIKHTDGNLQYLNMDFTNNSWVGHHLYLVSDDEIEEGLWCYNANGAGLENKIVHVTSLACKLNAKQFGWVKIVASTDESLNVARIPNDFIEKYVNAYNTNQPIENVDVEYDMVNINHGTNFAHKYLEALKSDHKDRVNIKLEKETRTRQEVLSILNDLSIDANIDSEYLSWWIKENL